MIIIFVVVINKFKKNSYYSYIHNNHGIGSLFRIGAGFESEPQKIINLKLNFYLIHYWMKTKHESDKSALISKQTNNRTETNKPFFHNLNIKLSSKHTYPLVHYTYRINFSQFGVTLLFLVSPFDR